MAPKVSPNGQRSESQIAHGIAEAECHTWLTKYELAFCAQVSMQYKHCYRVMQQSYCRDLGKCCLLAGLPDAAQDQKLLEGRQEVQAMGELHLVGLRAVIQWPPLLGPSQE